MFKWILRLMEPAPRSRDKARAKKEAAKERNRVSMNLSPLVPPTTSSEPLEEIQTEVVEHVRIPPDQITNFTQGHRTAVELEAINQAAMQRTALAAQQMSQAQMNALAHGMQQELGFLIGQDPLQGIPQPTTPYWKRMYGELGKMGGPYYPKTGK